MTHPVIRILRHHAWTGPGHLLETLKKKNIPCVVADADKDHPVSLDTENLSGLVILGADYSVNDDFPWIKDELRLLESAMRRKIPVMGHCFGAQLISVALGSPVKRMPQPEVGWYPLQIEDSLPAREWLGQPVDDALAVFWHEDFFALPKGVTPLLGTEYLPQQGFVLDNIVATGPHFEATAKIVTGWLDIYRNEYPEPSNTVQNRQTVLNDIGGKARAMHRLSDKLYDKWLRQVTEYIALHHSP